MLRCSPNSMTTWAMAPYKSAFGRGVSFEREQPAVNGLENAGSDITAKYDGCGGGKLRENGEDEIDGLIDSGRRFLLRSRMYVYSCVMLAAIVSVTCSAVP